jgi:hypothetical protein
MNPRDFLEQAEELIEGSREVDWRSAISRAYYAAFLVARDLFSRIGFVVPGDQGSHAYLWMRLNNSGRDEVIEAAGLLHDLRQARGDADYDMRRRVYHRDASDHVDHASQVIHLLDDLADSEAVLAQVIDAIRVYERDVLKQTTFRSPP